MDISDTGVLVAYIEAGCGTLTTSFGKHRVETKDTFIIDLAKPHKFHGVCKMLWVRVNGATTNRFYWSFLSDGGPVFHFAKDSPIPVMIENIIAELKTAEVPRTGIMSVHVYTIFGYVWDNAREAAKPNNVAPITKQASSAMMRSAIKYIDANLAERLTVSGIADKLHIDRSYFSREFSSFANESPKEYILSRRLDRSRHLLQTTNIPIRRIAASCGYSDATQFSRIFKKHTGISPKDFRRKNQL